MEKAIGWIGAGKMGIPMALRLAAGGHRVHVYDRSPEQMAIATDRGLVIAPDAGALISRSQIIFSSLPNDAALSAVATQVIDFAAKGSIFVDTSTVSPSVSADVALRCREAGIVYVRSTVSGNNFMAEAGQLTIMVSGSRQAFDQLGPLFRLIGAKQFYLGEYEEARLMKLVINLMIVNTSAMLAEALTLGRKGGLDWNSMWAVILESAVASPILKAKSVQLSVRDFSPTFTVEQMLKDLSLILEAGAQSQTPLLVTAVAEEMMKSAAAHGLGGEDYASIIKVAEIEAGLPLSAFPSGTRNERGP